MGKNLVVLERNLLLANYNQNLKITLWICLNSPRWNDNLKKMNKRKKGEIAENGYECLLWATGNFSLERKSCILFNSVSVGMFEIFMIETCLIPLHCNLPPQCTRWVDKETTQGMLVNC